MRVRDTGSSSATRIRAFDGASPGGPSSSGEGSVNFISFSFKFREPFLRSAKIILLAVSFQTPRQSSRLSRSESSELAQQFMCADGGRRRIALLDRVSNRLHNPRSVLLKNRNQLAHQFFVAL